MLIQAYIIFKNWFNDSLQKLRHYFLRILLLTLKPYKKTNPYPKKIRKILLIRRNRLGDAINILPIIDAIKKNYPHIEINILANKYNSQIFEYCNAITHLYIINSSLWLGQNFLFLNPTIRRLKKENFDLVVALGGYSSRLAKKTYFLNAKYSVGIGSDKYIFDLVYDKAVIFKKKNFKNHIEEMAALIRASGLSIPRKLPYTNLGLQNRPHKNWLAICPSSNRSESVYPPNLYVEVIKKILKGGKFKKITLFTMNAESSFKILTDYGCNHIVTDNLKLFINELSKYQYVLTSEGGTAHIAGALHLSVFIISGTKNQFYWKPHAKNIKTFVNTNSVNKINPELIAKALYKF